MTVYYALVVLLILHCIFGLADSNKTYGSEQPEAVQSLRHAALVFDTNNSTFTSARRLDVDATIPGMTDAMRTMMGLDIDELNYVGSEMTKAECRPKYGRLRYFKEGEKRNPPML